MNPINSLLSKFYLLTYIIITFLFLSSSQLSGQGFIESYSFGAFTGDVASHVVTIDSDIFIHHASVIDTPFTHVEGGMMKIDQQGNDLWRNIWSFDFGYVGTSFSNGIVTTQDTVYTTGNYVNLETGVFSPAIVANAANTGEFKAIRFPYDHRAAITDLFINNDETFTAISEDRVSEDSKFTIIVENINLSGQSTSSLEYLTEFARTSGTNSVRTSNGSIYAAHIGCLGPETNCYPFQGWLSKINADGSFAWSKSYGYTLNNQPVRPDVALLNDTTVAYAWTRDTVDFNIQESPPVIYYLDTIGNKQDSFAFHGNWRTVQKLIPCANGDLVGVGYARTDIRNAGWMFRLDGEANLVWERYVQDHRQTTGTITNLNTVTEGADGSIIAAGDIFHSFPPEDNGPRLRAWVVKLDADGCLEPGCTSDTIYLEASNASEEPDILSDRAITVWPNPTTDFLRWDIPDQQLRPYLTHYRITDALGRIVRHKEIEPNEQSVEVSNLPPGVYVLNLMRKHIVLGAKKFVKQ